MTTPIPTGFEEINVPLTDDEIRAFKWGVEFPPNGFDANNRSRVETKCHALVIERRNMSGMRVIESRGLEDCGWTEPLVMNGIEHRTHKYFCRKCRQVVSYDEARLIEWP